MSVTKYTDRSDTGTSVGVNTTDGSFFGVPQCADGEVITSFDVQTGRYIDRLSATCSNGEKLGPYGYSSGGTPYTVKGPFKSINGTAGDWVGSLFGLGQSAGSDTPFKLECPNGKYVVGFTGRAGEYLAGDFKAICGIKADEYCINHLETDLCRNTDVETLNKACALNMSTTCRNRKDELDESVIEKYCKTGNNSTTDDFCSCYMDPPPEIPEIAKGLVQCWNKKCATSGYVPKNIRNRDCVPITVCTQNLASLNGNSNIYSSNVTVMECPGNGTTTKDNSNTSNSNSNTSTSTPKPDANGNITGISTDPNKTYVPPLGATEDSFIKKNYMLLLLILFVVGAILYALFSGDSNPMPPPNYQNLNQGYPILNQGYQNYPMPPQNYPMPPQNYVSAMN